MKLAIIGASGKSGTRLVAEALERGHEVVAVCRDVSAEALDAYRGRAGFTSVTAPVLSDGAVLAQTLAGCDAAVVILISIWRLKATRLVTALAKAAAANGVRRFVFTAGEVTAAPDPGERLTRRQTLMLKVIPPLLAITPISMGDMIRASERIKAHPDWQWTIVRAPTLNDKSPTGYRFCELADVTTTHALSRADYAACLLDSVGDPNHHRRMLTVISAGN